MNTPMDKCSCATAARQLDSYLDRELTSDEIQEIEHHLEICTKCAEVYQQTDCMLSEIRLKLNHMAIPTDLKEKVFARLKSAQL